jgi:hypothetical protein
MRWTQRNIHEFGGDPNNVTIALDPSRDYQPQPKG